MEVAASELNPELNNQFIPKPLPFVEKNGFPHWLVSLLWYAGAFILFNIFGLFVLTIGAINAEVNLTDTNAFYAFIEQEINLQLLANTIGQFLIIGIGSLFIARLSANKKDLWKFLRIKYDNRTGYITLLAAILILVLYPTVNFLGWLNSFVPAPESWLEIQEMMMTLITSFLKENSIILALFYIGITPAICEEIMYRGYIQRSLEKSGGIWVAIIVSGVMFGAFHMQITHILPLSFLGIILAYLTYISDSLIPAIVAHFVNNGGQVIASSFYPAMLQESITPETEMPWELIAVSIIISSGIVYILHRMKPEASP